MKIKDVELTVRVDLTGEPDHASPRYEGEKFRPLLLVATIADNGRLSDEPEITGYRIQGDGALVEYPVHFPARAVQQPYVEPAVRLAHQWAAEAANVWSEVREQFED